MIKSVSKFPLVIECTVYTYALNKIYVHVHLIMVEIYETGCIIYLLIVKGARKVVHLSENVHKPFKKVIRRGFTPPPPPFTILNRGF